MGRLLSLIETTVMGWKNSLFMARYINLQMTT